MNERYCNMYEPKKVMLGDLLELINPYTTILIHDRKSEAGTVYEGPLIQMRTRWNDREVVWMRPYTNGFILEIE